MRTLLRAEVFGRAQAAIVARLRKRVASDAAIAEVMATVDDGAYAAAQGSYSDLRMQLQLECQAAMGILMEAGAAEAVLLLNALGGSEAVGAVLGKIQRGLDVHNLDGDVAQIVPDELAETLRGASTNPNPKFPGLNSEHAPLS